MGETVREALASAIQQHLDEMNAAEKRKMELLAEAEKHLDWNERERLQGQAQAQGDVWLKHWTWLDKHGIVDVRCLDRKGNAWVPKDGVDLIAIAIAAAR